jgi:hypothetical protein
MEMRPTARVIDQQDPGAYHYLLGEIETSLLGELRKILEGREADQVVTKRAREITDAIKDGRAE